MRLTTKGKFAVTALLDMAIHGNGLEAISLLSISKRQLISVSYLEQLFVKLRRSGIVKSSKGPGGGYRLAHPSSNINISSIIKAVDDDMDARSCAGKRNCKATHKCLTHDLWENLTTHIHNYLNQVTLQDLVPTSKVVMRQANTIQTLHTIKEFSL